MAAPAQVAADPTVLDLTDPQTFVDNDPYEMWRPLRDHHPMYWHPGRDGRPGFWVFTKYADVMTLYRDNKRFTSERGNVLTTLLEGSDSASRKMLAVTDGPRHRAIRNLMMKSFSPRVLAPVVANVRERTERLVDAALAKGELDFVSEVADQIPIHTISDLMGVPEADRERVGELNAQTLTRRTARISEFDSKMARNEMVLYIAELVAERRGNLGEDVLSTLATATVDGIPLTDEEIILNSYSLILGGDESSRGTATGMALAFARHPDQWRKLKKGEVDQETATEEILRWTVPTMHFGRHALTDVPMRGRTIGEGEIITLWNIAANFDEDVFPDPYTFDLERRPNKHVTFGHGPHFCLGAYLGRVHATAMLEALRDKVAEIEVLERPEPILSNFAHGCNGLRVRLTPEPSA